MENNKDFLHKAADFLSDKGFELLTIFSGLLFVIGDFIQCHKYLSWTLFIIAFALQCFSCYKLWKKSKSVFIIEEECKKKAQHIQMLEATIVKQGKESAELFRYILSNLFKTLKLDNTSRISVYRKKGEQFMIIGRYSSNPELAQEYRKFYPITEGFIGIAFTKGYYFVDNLPEYKDGTK